MTHFNEEWSRRQVLGRGMAALAGLGIAMTEAHAKPQAQGSGELAKLRPEHPRLIASPKAWERIKAQRSKDTLLDAFLKRCEVEGRALLPVAPVTYEKRGKRLLTVSRTVVRRVLFLSMLYQVTGDKAFASRVEAEMRAVSAFADWNPSHFLDVGEMTLALGLGYDWLYDVLSPDARNVIATAIIEKGLRPGLTTNSWTKVENNWNQVCLGGLTVGALAVAEREPALAAQIVEQTKQFNINGLKPYAPDGVYPEGASYWNYGTTYQTVLLDALDTALGTDWKLRDAPGFLVSADALYQQLAPTGIFYNFADGGERAGLEPAPWWFARATKRPDLLVFETERLSKWSASTAAPRPDQANDRLLPLAVLWWPEAGMPKAKPSLPLNWHGRGPNPLVVFRSTWNDPNAFYLGAKGGAASLNHAHMDAGSFVFEADGVRWARDLGAQDYNSLESKGVDLWNRKQDSERWTVFRLNNFSHNTLTINNQLHRMVGNARITHFAPETDKAGAIIDLSPVFEGQASRVTRGFSFHPGSHALVRDEITGLKSGDTVRWAMMTLAEVTTSGEEAILRQNGKTLRVRLKASVPARFEVVSAEKPPQEYDAPNPGAKLLVINLSAPQSGNINVSVTLQPVATPDAPPLATNAWADTPLQKWPLPQVKG